MRARCGRTTTPDAGIWVRTHACPSTRADREDRPHAATGPGTRCLGRRGTRPSSRRVLPMHASARTARAPRIWSPRRLMPQSPDSVGTRTTRAALLRRRMRARSPSDAQIQIHARSTCDCHPRAARASASPRLPDGIRIPRGAGCGACGAPEATPSGARDGCAGEERAYMNAPRGVFRGRRRCWASVRTFSAQTPIFIVAVRSDSGMGMHGV